MNWEDEEGLEVAENDTVTLPLLSTTRRCFWLLGWFSFFRFPFSSSLSSSLGLEFEKKRMVLFLSSFFIRRYTFYLFIFVLFACASSASLLYNDTSFCTYEELS